MSKHLKSVFGSGTEVGSGLAWSVSPFSDFVVTDFYDGAIEGFARVPLVDRMIFFHKIWWDERQDNRLFEAFVFPAADLQVEAQQLFAFFAKWSKVSDWSKPFSAADQKLADQLAQFARRPNYAVRVHIFCKSITDEVLILPVESD